MLTLKTMHSQVIQGDKHVKIRGKGVKEMAGQVAEFFI